MYTTGLITTSYRYNIIDKLFRTLVKCSNSNPRELRGQGSLKTKGAASGPAQLRKLGGM